MIISRKSAITLGAASSAALLLSGCGAGSRVGNENATEVTCDYPAPEGATTVNVLAYNSSAVDPFTNTMVSSCTKGDVTVQHDPIDFAGQVTKTTATLAGDTGTYDIIETYGFVIPDLASKEQLTPLDDLVDQYSEQYGLDAISDSMREGLTFEGSLYALPMQAQMFVLAYRADVFEELGLEPPTTMEEMVAAAEQIQSAGTMDYPLALPWLATADITTSFQAAMNSLGADFVDENGAVTLDTPEAREALQALSDLTPFMDPQVGTFDQPKVQQQMYNGTAAMAIMFSGRMYDLTQESNSEHAANIAFAPPPRVHEDAPYAYGRLSIDCWSIPHNTQRDPEMLFIMMASSITEEASLASIPAAYPAREGMVTAENSPYGEAANASIEATMPPIVSPFLAPINTEIIPLVAEVLTGGLGVDEGAAQMQQAAEGVVG